MDLNTGLTSVERLIRQADEARDAADPERAAQLYRDVLAVSPDRNDVKVQLGNMLKDAGKLREAAGIYREAQVSAPDDADICVQMGHVLKLMGNRTAAFEQYQRAVRLNPTSWAAAQELAEAGHSWQMQQRFEVNLRARGAEALLLMSRQIEAMRETLDALSAKLPDAMAHAAFPIDLYSGFRDVYDIPPPPPEPRVPVTILLLADREAPATLYRQFAALREQTHADWTLCAIGRDPARQAIVAAAAASDQRIAWIETADDPAAAEWAAACAAPGAWLLLLAPGAILQRQAVAWVAAGAGLAPARAFVVDEDRIAFDRGLVRHDDPVLRQVVDYDTLLEANVFGETIAVSRAAYEAAILTAPEGPPARARSRLLLELARGGGIGHIPFALVSAMEPRRAALPEHRIAVADHAAAHGFAPSLQIAKGERGPTLWAPRAPTATITVIIPTRDNAYDLANFIDSLRATAEAPDNLRLVVVANGSTQPETFELLAELGAKRHTTVMDGETPFNWSRLNNMAVRSVDSPYVVFANDDMLMTTENWDMRLRGLLEREEVGAVGARLLYGDDTVQHAGVLFGWKNNVIHDGLYELADTPGPTRRLQVTRAASAVTGAFLAMRRERFLAAGGFDESGLPIAYSDVDLALKLRAQGLKVLWTPAITLRHYESKTRGMDQPDAAKNTRNKAELAVMDARWGAAFEYEPSLHPAWYAATLPYRLIVAPSAETVLAHIRRTAAVNPWQVDPPAA